ncbi:Beta-1 [Mactra antiquata]
MMWSRILITKCILLTVVLLISIQYLVNVSLLRRKDSVILLNLIDSSLGNWLNQTSLLVQDSVRNSVTTPARNLKQCDVISPHLRGYVRVNTQVAAWAQIEEENSNLRPGGRYQPPDCVARNRVAVIIPYRDRDIHLKIFMRNIHPFLQNQQLDYGIFVVEMAQNITFNRALLMNVGFVEAMKSYNYQCFIFHDVDLLPEDDRNLYTCPNQPRHMSVAIDSLKYRLPYPQIFGGVSAITKDQFKKVNGFSNIFFGWGGEDDDMYRRILYSNLTVTRYSPEVARYKMLVHVKDHGNPDRYTLLKTVKARQKTDGLTSLKYEVIKSELRNLYTWILISVNKSEIIENEPIHSRLLKDLKNAGKQKQKQAVVQIAGQKPGQKSAIKVISDKQGKVAINNNPPPQKVIQVKDTANIVKSNINQNNVEATNNNKNNNPKNANVENNNKNNKDPPKKAPVKKPVRKVKAKMHAQVSWIPADFKGILPNPLTKFKPLPIVDVKKPKPKPKPKNVAKRGGAKPNGAKPGGAKPNGNKPNTAIANAQKPKGAKPNVPNQNVIKQNGVQENVAKPNIVDPNLNPTVNNGNLPAMAPVNANVQVT